jgi:predicted GNAT family acetyltransferase
MSVTVADVPELSRYEARVDGRVAGFAVYHRRGDLVVFTHTEVDSEHEGQGVASALAREALDDVRRRGLRALLRCPFLSEWATRHPEYDDVLTHREAHSDTG